MTAPVVVVTANPAIDVTYRLDRNLPGETNRVRQVLRRPGGKGLNVAHVLTALGVAAHNVMPLGADSGAWMRDRLAGDPGAGTLEAVPVSGRTRSTVAILADEGHPTMYVEPGPHLSEAEWRAVTAAVAAACTGARFLAVSGSLPAGTSPGIVGEWVRVAHRAGARVLVDSSGPALLEAARAGADILKPNAHELLSAAGRPDLAGAVAVLRGLGASRLVVSQGRDGLLAFEPEAPSPLRVPAVPGVTGNPTGAGDAAAAGLIAALHRGHPFATALRWAAAAGAAAVRQPVAGVIDLSDFDQDLAVLGAPAR